MTDLGETYTIEIDSKMELENVMALLEAEVSGFRRCIGQAQVFPCDKSGIPRTEQSISYEGRELSNEKTTMEGLGVSENAVLLLRRKINVAGRCASWTWYAIPSNITLPGPQDS